MRGGDMVEKRGYLVPCHPIISYGRAETLALLCEAANRNAVWAPNSIPLPRRGRGRGLGSLLPQEQGVGSLLHAHPQLEPGTVGMARARSRNPVPHPCPDPPLHVPNSWPRCLCPHGDDANSPPPEAPFGPPSLVSITSSKLSKSGYGADPSHDFITTMTSLPNLPHQ